MRATRKEAAGIQMSVIERKWRRGMGVLLKWVIEIVV